MAAVQSRRRGPVPTGGIIQPKIFGLPIDREVLFSNHKNIYKKSIEKRQRKLFLKLPFLKNFLEPGETIFLATTGYSPVTRLQKLLIGWFFIHLKRSLYVFTNQRIFHIPTNPSYRYRHTIAEIPYGNCQAMEVKGNGLVIEYAGSGVKEKFGGLAGKERRKVREIIKKVPPVQLAQNKQSGSGRAHLCPRCAGQLNSGQTVCEACKLKFKNKTAATLLALIFPGGGYFYTRRYLLGVLTFLLELGLAAVIYISLIDVMEGMAERLFWLVPTALALGIEKTVAIAHAWELVSEYIPRTRKFTPVPRMNRRRKLEAVEAEAAPAL